MAVTATLLTSGSNTSALDTYDTASVTPGANRLILLFAVATGPSITAITATGNGLTWVEVATASIDVRDIVVLRAMGAAPTAGAVTIDPNNSATSCQWVVVEFDGVDTSGTNGSGAVVQFKGYTNAVGATSATITLDAAIGAGNAVAAGFGIPAQEAITPGTGYTELAETSIGGPNGTLEVEFDATGTTTADASWTSSLANVVGVAVEIADAAAGGTNAAAENVPLTATANDAQSGVAPSITEAALAAAAHDPNPGVAPSPGEAAAAAAALDATVTVTSSPADATVTASAQDGSVAVGGTVTEAAAATAALDATISTATTTSAAAAEATATATALDATVTVAGSPADATVTASAHDASVAVAVLAEAAAVVAAAYDATVTTAGVSAVPGRGSITAGRASGSVAATRASGSTTVVRAGSGAVAVT